MYFRPKLCDTRVKEDEVLLQHRFERFVSQEAFQGLEFDVDFYWDLLILSNVRMKVLRLFCMAIVYPIEITYMFFLPFRDVCRGLPAIDLHLSVGVCSTGLRSLQSTEGLCTPCILQLKSNRGYQEGIASKHARRSFITCCERT